MNKKYYICGSTVRLVGEFYDFENNPIDAVFPRVIIYDYKYSKLEEYNLTEENRTGVGKYFFDFVSDMSEKIVIYEFCGEIDGTPSLNRGSFRTKFIIE